MKVVLIRHIKSDWSSEKSDFDRPIREDRKADAAIVSKALKNTGITPDSIIASPAKRTQQTAKLFAKAFSFPIQRIEYIDIIYESTKQELWAITQQLNSNTTCVFIICHNPAITDFINTYTNARIDNVPTCGCIVLNMKGNQFIFEQIYYR
jgi:phosphohistidine phosphatase